MDFSKIKPKDINILVAQLQAEIDVLYEWLDDARNRDLNWVRTAARIEVEDSSEPKEDGNLWGRLNYVARERDSLQKENEKLQANLDEKEQKLFAIGDKCDAMEDELIKLKAEREEGYESLLEAFNCIAVLKGMSLSEVDDMIAKVSDKTQKKRKKPTKKQKEHGVSKGPGRWMQSYLDPIGWTHEEDQTCATQVEPCIPADDPRTGSC